jgi:hypothetical protein
MTTSLVGKPLEEALQVNRKLMMLMPRLTGPMLRTSLHLSSEWL